MPSAANLVLTDRAATPVNHTFIPFGKNADGTFEFHEVTGIPSADPKITALTRKTAAGKLQSKIRIAVPVISNSTVNGISVPVLLRTNYAEVTLTFEATSTLQERKDLTSYTKCVLDSTINTAANAWLVDNAINAGAGIY